MMVLSRLVFFRIGIMLAILNEAGTITDDKEVLAIEEMKGSSFREIVWSSVQRMGSSGQIVGLLDVSNRRTSSVERGETQVRDAGDEL